MIDFELEEMIQQQLVSRGIDDQRVIEAFRRMPRRYFIPEYLHVRAHEDERLPIGCGQTVSPPYLVARMLQEMRIEPEAHLLEVGTGAGYQTALLSTLAKRVHTMEILPELSARARRLLNDELGLDNVHFRVGDGYQGWSDLAPFDAIVVNAAADEVPFPLLGQLRAGGRLVIPIGEREQTLYAMEGTDVLGEATTVHEEAIDQPFVRLAGEAQEGL